MHTKRLILIGASVGTGIATWWASFRWLSAVGQFSDWRYYLLPLFLVIVYAAVASISLTLLRGRWDRLAVITSSWGVFVIFFPASVWYLSVLPLFFLFWMEASRRDQQELAERHKLRVSNVVAAGARFILLGIFLMISLGFYSLRTDGVITLNTISEGVQRQVGNAYESNLVQSQLSDVPPSLQSQFQQDFARAVDSFIRRWLAPLSPYLPPILAFVLFLGLWSIIGLIREPVLWIASGLFLVMRRTGFVSVVQEQVPKEVVKL